MESIGSNVIQPSIPPHGGRSGFFQRLCVLGLLGLMVVACKADNPTGPAKPPVTSGETPPPPVTNKGGELTAKPVVEPEVLVNKQDPVPETPEIKAEPEKPTTEVAAVTASAPCPGSLAKSLTLEGAVPGDSSLTNQADADCFAWQQFIGLNWKAAASMDGNPDPTATPANFGDPTDTSPVVWETYMDAHLVFNETGSEPPAWGTEPPVPASCTALLANSQAPDSKRTTLRMTAKTKSTAFTGFLQGDSAQATSPPNWLGAQNGTNLWYEVRMSQDEYNYIVDPANKFYDANQQLAYYMTGPGSKGVPMNLPKGELKGGKTIQLGALEVKAAWMVVTDEANPKWARYKRSSAFAYSPETDTCQIVTVALVGLHVLHKTTTQPTWVWATFEHMDNVKDAGDPPPPDGYNIYNPNCQPQTVQVAGECLPKPKAGSTTVTVGCDPNVKPPYNLGAGCPSVPIQVERVVPISPTSQQITTTATTLIKQNNPDSVWQYYKLVDVIWSTNPQTEQPIKVPLAVSSLQPTTPVANTTMETYATTKNATGVTQLSCLDCHKFASIAPSPGNKNPQFTADFSFAFSTARASKP